MSFDRIVFRCAREGLATTLAGGLIGGYDGAGSWALFRGNLRPGDEQLMVETHEGLHHELQSSTAYGRLAASALLLARRAFRPAALTELFYDMVDRSVHTQETFATTISSYVVGVDSARKLLHDNTEYLAHLERGCALAGLASLPPAVRDAATAAVLRVAMAPASLFEVLEQGYNRLGRRAFGETDHPDARLEAFERSGGAATWGALAEELAAEPDHVEVLPRRCYEHVAGVLAREGLLSVPWDRQLEVADLFKNAVSQVDPELGDRLNIVADRRPILDDALEYDRQVIQLRDRLPARTVDTATTLASLRAFQSRDAEGRPHVCGVWLRRQVAHKQFAFKEELPEVVVALMAPMRLPEGEVLVFGLLPSDWTPRQVQNVLGNVPLLPLTTHLTLADDSVMAMLRTVQPVFVLMDLPVAWHVQDWLRQDASVRMALVPLDGLTDVQLLMLAFDVDRAPGFRFVHIGGQTGSSLLAERLRQLHGERLEISGEVLRRDVVTVNLMLNHVLGSWHVLDQDGVE